MDGRRKNYRAWDPQQNGHDAISPHQALPEGDLVFFLIDLIPQLDLAPFHGYYARDLRGQPPFDVTMMVTLLVYAYAVGVCSSRKIAAACERNLAFRAIVGDDRPDFRTISDFRKLHTAALKPLFLEVLRVAGELGMVKLGNLATDGTKMRANASRHKAMSYGYMDKEMARLEAEIERLLRDAERCDAEQDAALGGRRGDELPDELKRREDRLAKIREAKARLEAEARARAEAEQRRRDEAQARREAEGRKPPGKEPAPIEWSPEDKAQTNFTDPEAKVMKQSNKGFDYSYNAQAVVDGEDQIIVAAEVTAATNDKQQAVPMATSGAGEPGGGRDRAAAGGRRGQRRRSRTRRTPATSARERSRVWSGSAWTRTWRSNARSIMRSRSPRSRRPARRRRARRSGCEPSCGQRPARCSTRRGSGSSSRCSARRSRRGASAGSC